MGRTIQQLKMEEKRLRKLANKQLIADRKINEAKEEKRRLKVIVRTLKRRTSRTVLARTRRLTKTLKSRATTPQAKRKIKGIRSEIKRRFSKLQDFADKFG